MKTESPSPQGCLLRDVPGPPPGAVQISMGLSSDGSSGNASPDSWGPWLEACCPDIPSFFPFTFLQAKPCPPGSHHCSPNPC